MMQFFPTGWAHYLIGGLLIGVGVSLMYLFTGRVAGMSTVFTSTWSFLSDRPFFQQARYISTRSWRLVLGLGLILGAALWWWLLGPSGGVTTDVPWWRLLAGGVLVGYGARMSEGCTSGHGICGLASLSRTSFIAVLTFLATAIVTANLMAAFGIS